MSSWALHVIFDVEHDRELQAKLNSAMGSRIITCSEPRPADARDWPKRVSAKMKRASAVLVLCSGHTGSSAQVDAELQIAQKAGKPYFLIQLGSDEAEPPPSARAADLILNLPDRRR
jgi:hypothetical protein